MIRRRIFSVALAFALPGVATCGGDDSVALRTNPPTGRDISLEDYGDILLDYCIDYRTEWQKMMDEVGGEIDTVEDLVLGTEIGIATFEDVVEQLRPLHPPIEVSEQHDRLVWILDQQIANSEEMIKAVEADDAARYEELADEILMETDNDIIDVMEREIEEASGRDLRAECDTAVPAD